MRLLILAAASLMWAAPLRPSRNSVAADPCARQMGRDAGASLFAAPASPDYRGEGRTVAAAHRDGTVPTGRAPRLARAGLFPVLSGQVVALGGKLFGRPGLRRARDRQLSGGGRSADVDRRRRRLPSLPASDYEGSIACDAPRKIVQFALEAKQPLMLQLSGARRPAVRIAIVRAAGE